MGVDTQLLRGGLDLGMGQIRKCRFHAREHHLGDLLW